MSNSTFSIKPRIWKITKTAVLYSKRIIRCNLSVIKEDSNGKINDLITYKMRSTAQETPNRTERFPKQNHYTKLLWGQGQKPNKLYTLPMQLIKSHIDEHNF